MHYWHIYMCVLYLSISPCYIDLASVFTCIIDIYMWSDLLISPCYVDSVSAFYMHLWYISLWLAPACKSCCISLILAFICTLQNQFWPFHASRDHHSYMRLWYISLISVYIWIYAPSLCLLSMCVNKPCNGTPPYIHNGIFNICLLPACVLPCHTWFISISFGRHMFLLAYLIHPLPFMCAPQYPHLCSFFLLSFLLLHLLYSLFYLPMSFHASFIHVDICIHSLAWLTSLFLFSSWLSFLCAYCTRISLVLMQCAFLILELWAHEICFKWCDFRIGLIKCLKKTSLLTKGKKQVISYLPYLLFFA